ncbi:Eisosome component PIL1-domain-containing protein [Aspergillus karnatakaensis]|uniref:Eisosome component PIL1-domain-containing protein n=1 Tax=Aspergillus karnatakaensis TaxID=1810916 RepID=UPI003CCD0814
MNRVIKSENAAISAHESAARQRMSIAAQLSEWGETTEDEAISDISDKMGVLMAEIGEQEDVFAQNLEEYRTVLKHIRDTESSVQPTRDQRAKIADDIGKLKLKEPGSHRIETMEQELVRAEAQNLVAEAQLTNVTRQRFKEAYGSHLAAVIERGEKQILLARHARRLLNCLDDTSVIPGDQPKEYQHADEAKQIIEEAERELHSWESSVEPIESKANAETTGTSRPLSGAAGTESQTESQEEEADPAQTEESSVSYEDYHQGAPVAGQDYRQSMPTAAQDYDPSAPAAASTEVPRHRVHSMSAPMMDEGLEDRALAAAAPSIGMSGGGENKEQRVPGMEGLEEGTGSSQNAGGVASHAEFPMRAKKNQPTRLGSPLDTQIQRSAVPI